MLLLAASAAVNVIQNAVINLPGMKDGMLVENNEEAVVAAGVVVVDFNRPPSTESPPRPHTEQDFLVDNDDN